MLFIFLSSLQGISQEPGIDTNKLYSSTAIYGETLTLVSWGIKYDRNILKKNKFYRCKINAGIGISAVGMYGSPLGVSCPVEVNLLFGSLHRFQLGFMALNIFWFTKDYHSSGLFGGGDYYGKNNFSTPFFIRLGYRYQKKNNIFLKTSIGPYLFEYYNNYPSSEFFPFNFSQVREDLYYPEDIVQIILFFLWPSIGIGVSLK